VNVLAISVLCILLYFLTKFEAILLEIEQVIAILLLLLAANNIIIDEQHGFRKRFSCETQLITTIHDWAKSINKKSQTLAKPLTQSPISVYLPS
jgi:hypothetical protein